MKSDSNSVDPVLKNTETPKAKPTIKVRINHNANPYLLLLRKIEEQNTKIDLLQRGMLHLINIVSKSIEDKRYDAVRERERRWSHQWHS